MNELQTLLQKQEYNHRIYNQRTELENKMLEALGRWDMDEFHRLSEECDKLQYVAY